MTIASDCEGTGSRIQSVSEEYERYGTSAPEGLMRPIKRGDSGVERSIATVWFDLASSTAVARPDAESASRAGSSVASKTIRPTSRLVPARKSGATISSAGKGFFGSPSAWPELSKSKCLPSGEIARSSG